MPCFGRFRRFGAAGPSVPIPQCRRRRADLASSFRTFGPDPSGIVLFRLRRPAAARNRLLFPRLHGDRRARPRRLPPKGSASSPARFRLGSSSGPWGILGILGDLGIWGFGFDMRLALLILEHYAFRDSSTGRRRVVVQCAQFWLSVKFSLNLTLG